MTNEEIADGYDALALSVEDDPGAETYQGDRALTYRREAERLRMMADEFRRVLAEQETRARDVEDAIRHRAAQERLLSESNLVQQRIACALLDLAAAVRGAKAR